MAPFLHDRPLVLREPGRGRFVRQAPADTPDFVAAVGITSPDTGKTVDYLLAQDRRSLMWLADRGHTELHAWHSRVTSLGRPDYAFFDLDPAAGAGFDLACEVALLLKAELDRLGLRSYPKTSGLTGLQVYVPTEPRSGFGQVRAWTRAVCGRLNAAHPDITTMEWRVEERRGVFLDHMMMAPNKNAVVALSPRERGGEITVSMPLTWDEVSRKPDPSTFTIGAGRRRLERAAQIFAPVVEGGQRLPIQGASRESAHTAGPDWRDAGRRLRLSCVVGGWAPPEGEPGERMGSVLLGLYYLDELVFVGKAPVDHDQRHELYVRIAENRQEESPFINLGSMRGARWAGPALVARVECSGLTGGPSLRAPRYLGLDPRAEPRSCALDQLAA
jgi:bifunctional non-homologous end joining protein LigD